MTMISYFWIDTFFGPHSKIIIKNLEIIFELLVSKSKSSRIFIACFKNAQDGMGLFDESPFHCSCDNNKFGSCYRQTYCQ